jgi:hypothetical protein
MIATASPMPRTRIEEAKASIDYEAIRARNPLAEYCQKRGIQLRRNGGADQLVGLCPLHREKTGSFHVYLDDDHYHCFGCGAHGDVTDLEQALGGGTRAEAAERLGAERTRSVRPLPKAPKQEPEPIITTDNPFGLPHRMSADERGICMDCVTRLLNTENAIESIAHQRGWKPETIRDLALEPSLGITDERRLAFLYESGCKVRWQENGERKIRWAFGKPWLWRFGYVKQARTLFVCEGETDAITLIDSGLEEDRGTLVVALPSASFHIDRWASLFAGKRVIIATDADEAGMAAANHLVEALNQSARSLGRLDLGRMAHE